MLPLIFKELYLQRYRLVFILALILVITVIVIFTTADEFSVAILFLMVYTFSVLSTAQLCYQEEKNGSFSFLRSLPLHPRRVVSAKFAAMLLLTATLGLLALALSALVFFTNRLGFSVWPEILLWLNAGMVLLIYNGLILFIYFHWGYTKVQLFFSGSALLLIIWTRLLREVLPSVGSLWEQLTIGQQLAVTAVVLYLTWFTSVKALSRLEL